MTVLQAVVIGVLMGIVFGFALEKSRVFEPGIIVGQMQLRNTIMVKVFLTGVATGAVVLAALNGFGVVKLHPKAALYVADVAGGLLLGAGIALAGACPGTVLAQLGAGYRDAAFTVVGGVAGALAFGYAEPALRPLLAWGGDGRITFASVTGIPYWVLALALAIVIVAVLAALERRRPWRRELGGDVDGDLQGRPPSPSADRAPLAPGAHAPQRA
jgi:hypothetical protein